MIFTDSRVIVFLPGTAKIALLHGDPDLTGRESEDDMDFGRAYPRIMPFFDLTLFSNEAILPPNGKGGGDV